MNALRRSCTSITGVPVLCLESPSGNNNTALGFNAGIYVSEGSNNIEIGNNGASTDSNTIKIGSSQSSTFIAGIFNSPLSGAANVIVTQRRTSGCGRVFRPI